MAGSSRRVGTPSDPARCAAVPRPGSPAACAQAARAWPVSMTRKRQAEQGNMAVERRWRRVVGNDGDAREIVSQQAQERRLYLEYHLPRLFLQRRHIAAELQRVAQALSRMHKDGLAFQLALAQPRTASVRAGLPAILPSPFIVVPAVLELSDKQIGLGAVVARAGVLRIDGQGGLEVAQRLVLAVLITCQHAKIGMGVHMPGIAPRRVLVGTPLHVPAAQRASHHAADEVQCRGRAGKRLPTPAGRVPVCQSSGSPGRHRASGSDRRGAAPRRHRSAGRTASTAPRG